MPAKRLHMRKLREIIRLRLDAKMSARAIAQSCNISPSTVVGYLGRIKAAKLSWPLPDELDDAALTALLFPTEHKSPRSICEPDYAYLHTELRRKHVTKMLLWQEYIEQHPEGLQYSQFCERYNRWAASLNVTMRQSHRAGEKMFVDFSGDGIDIIDPNTGECTTAKLFVAVLGASNMTWAEPVLSEDLPTWIRCHNNACAYFGGVSEIIVPDNLKSGVTRPDYYDPEINGTYADWARHYGTVVIPARKRKPRDKAKAEQGVLHTERQILAALRDEDFTSLPQLRAATSQRLEVINNRPMQKLGKSRRELFDAVEAAALKPVPTTAFEIAEWKKVTVNIDYHIEFDHHYYSVHHSLYGSGRGALDVRATSTTVEILRGGKRVATHVRSYEKHRASTKAEHMPDSHRRYLKWTPSRIINWARTVGPCTAQVVEEIMRRRPHPEQGFRSCMGILRLRDSYSDERIESACEHAVRHRTYSRRSILAILKNNRDRLKDDEPAQQSLPLHGNIRGAGYYH